ncbi:MAG: TIGR03936 family radical SAM-associated protein, partial [Chloroflexi bacterium]|nr:TIGR03936 family radical SAM-associated protein [Chloroflexota bacterium]
MTAVQRLRVSFSRGEAAKYVSHLDLARLWERALRRARLPVAYSAGFTPHARLAFAAPLAVGITASAELVDVYLSELVPPR